MLDQVGLSMAALNAIGVGRGGELNELSLSFFLYLSLPVAPTTSPTTPPLPPRRELTLVHIIIQNPANRGADQLATLGFVVEDEGAVVELGGDLRLRQALL